MQINHGGVDIFMSQAVFDIGNGVAATEHIDRSWMPEAVGGMDGFKTFGRQGAAKIFLAQAVDARAC